MEGKECYDGFLASGNHVCIFTGYNRWKHGVEILGHNPGGTQTASTAKQFHSLLIPEGYWRLYQERKY